MSAISPIVGISKIISQYSTIVVGFNGVLYDGKILNIEALKALAEAYKYGKRIILLSNTDMRVGEIIKIFNANKIPLKIFSLIMTAGEIVYTILHRNKRFSELGKKYFCLGDQKNAIILEKIGLQRVFDINQADFVFVGGIKDENETIEKYSDVMQIAYRE